MSTLIDRGAGTVPCPGFLRCAYWLYTTVLRTVTPTTKYGLTRCPTFPIAVVVSAQCCLWARARARARA